MHRSMNDSRFADACGLPSRTAFVTAILTAVAIAILAAPSPAAAQYFGQNKVRYTTMDFKVLATEHFDIHFYEEKRDAAFEVGRMAERWHARLSAVFGEPLSSRQTIVLYASHPDFRGTTVVPERHRRDDRRAHRRIRTANRDAAGGPAGRHRPRARS